MSSIPKRDPDGTSSMLSSVLALILNSNTIEVLGKLWQLGRRIFSMHAHGGLYEVLEHESVLEICDDTGETAVHHKRQRVRFLQDNIIAYQDMAWGDGEIFAEYECAPGEPVDRYREGHRWHVLISLRETKQRGDEEEFRIRRMIIDGFTQQRETFQIEINHRTQQFSMSVIFPQKRYPRRVTLVERNLSRVRELKSDERLQLPDGRLQTVFRTGKPRLFEAYILRWEW